MPAPSLFRHPYLACDRIAKMRHLIPCLMAVLFLTGCYKSVGSKEKSSDAGDTSTDTGASTDSDSDMDMHRRPPQVHPVGNSLLQRVSMCAFAKAIAHNAHSTAFGWFRPELPLGTALGDEIGRSWNELSWFCHTLLSTVRRIVSSLKSTWK